ncbi:aminotransferase class I/II-fold pyridoxal phosphate-dependent enzyme [Pediococcus argentinicus]|uniref:aminotransferase class I/II-fold pyridoxal phosphate-dependent enzyme n=1 Tax=Pediococcus argentinicus TaxID=480391 RepID=UPI00338DDA84
MPNVDLRCITQINRDVQKLQPSAIRAFDTQVSSIPGITKLTLGEPDFDTAAHVKEAGINDIATNDSHYGATAGKPELRKVIAEYLQRHFDLNYTADEVLVTVGATEAITVAMKTILNPGDTVLIPTPVYSAYHAVATMLGVKSVLLNTSPTDFKLTPITLKAALDANPGIKALILNYPSNPTGVTYSKTELEELVQVIKQSGIWVISDEIYAELTYEKQHTSFAKLLPEQTICINGVSKAYAMTGYRVGYIAGPADLMPFLTKVHQFMVTVVPNVTQAAAIEAISNGDAEIDKMREIYHQRQQFMKHALNKLGYEVVEPRGAFYLFIQIPTDFVGDSFAYALELAQEACVAVIPGTAFGPGGERYVRLSYAASMEKLNLAIEKITKYQEEIKSEAM